MAMLYQMLFASGVEAFIHFVLATGSLLIALAVFDFSRVPRWITWVACLAVGAEAVIFLVQGVSLLIPNESLAYLAFQVLGQRLESILVDIFVLWCVAVLLWDSQDRTRVFGIVSVFLVICYEIYKYGSFYLGGIPMESLKLVFLPLFVWLLFESRKQRSLQPGSHP